VIHRFSTAGLTAACSALLIGSAVLLVAPSAAQAAPQERSRAAAAVTMAASKIAQAEPATTGAIGKSDEQPACDRPRRRLWVEGEGWVVRRVSACH
jgi:hypothetical protein